MRLLFLARSVVAVAPLVRLDYASYAGTALPNGVSQWLGMRYAAPPTGSLRFAAPADPERQVDGGAVQRATAHGPICIATGAGPPTAEMNEDCLFLDVYAPSNATLGSRLPVYFFIQGGGFNANSNANQNGSGLVEASDLNMIVVTHNYRVGPWGFLASPEVAKGGSINNGLKDQRKAMQWVQKYIHLFGGDPKQVTMGGDSAGGQSVTLQVTAYCGRNDGLFHAVASESQSASALRTVNDSSFAYNGLVIRAGCASATDTLACLRSLDATALQAVNINQPFPGAQQAPLYMYGPTLDYDFVSDYTYRAYAQGKFVRVPAIYGDDTNEGTVFTPRDTSSVGEGDTFLHNQFPALSLAQLARINQLYPLNSNTPVFAGAGPYWRPTADAYGEMRYICPGIFDSAAFEKRGAPTWNYRWNVIDPPAAEQGYGVTHTVEIGAIWGPDNVANSPASYHQGGVNHPIVAETQAYFISFVRSRNPNTYRKLGTPEWLRFAGRRRLMFQTNATRMEAVPADQRTRCEYLWSVALDLAQ